MLIKICGITNLDDALAAADAGASALGFNFWPNSPRYIEPRQARPIIDALPSHVLPVGVFVQPSPGLLAEVLAHVPLRAVQIHGQYPGRLEGIKLWRALAVTPDWNGTLQGEADAWLLDAPSGELWGGTGRTFDWSKAVGLRQRIILAGGLDASNVWQAIQMVQPWGVDACSRLEVQPGRKDHAKMRAFIAAAREAI
jgi:phosphoribosylanthranilate isomerase